MVILTGGEENVEKVTLIKGYAQIINIPTNLPLESITVCGESINNAKAGKKYRVGPYI